MRLADVLPLQSNDIPSPEYSVLTIMVGLLPVLALLSGMAMTPYLVLLTLLLGAAYYRARTPNVPALVRDGRAMLVVPALVVAVPVLSIPWSITPAASAAWALKTTAIMLIGAAGLLASRRLPGLSSRSALAFAASILICVVFVLAEQLPHGGILALGYDAFAANFDKFIHKNINRGLCALAVFVWPAALALDRAGMKVQAQVLPWLTALPIAVMHSLSAKLAIIFGFAAFYGLRAMPVRGPRILTIIIPAFFVLWPIGFNLFYNSFFAAPAIYQRLPASSQARVDIWHFVSARIAERPTLGWGMESSRAIPGGTTEYVPGRTYLPLHPHNNALQVLLEEGVIGFALTLTALVIALRAWRRHWSSDPLEGAAGGALIMAFLVIGFSAFGIWQTWWIAVAWIAAALFEIARRGKDQPSSL